jgi:hypothetical protein
MVVQRHQASTLMLRWSSGPLQGGKNEVEPCLEHDPSFASDSPHNGILCVVLALMGVLYAARSTKDSSCPVRMR